MKNLVNYLDEYLDDINLYEACCKFSKEDTNNAALKAYKKKSREEEIETHGKLINHNKVFKSKRDYTRKEKHKNKYR
jgi:hypothetical protein